MTPYLIYLDNRLAEAQEVAAAAAAGSLGTFD
jgi:hypothetical protein